MFLYVFVFSRIARLGFQFHSFSKKFLARLGVGINKRKTYIVGAGFQAGQSALYLAWARTAGDLVALKK